MYINQQASRTKKASMRDVLTGAAAVALPVGAYTVAKNKGRASSRKEWTDKVKQNALKRIRYHNNRYRLSTNYIRGVRQAMRSNNDKR
jgi:3-hydroxy-3-methylglutaryl CoA synthase